METKNVKSKNLKILFLFFIVSFIPLVITSSISYYYSNKYLMEGLKENFSLTSKILKTDILDKMNTYKQMALTIAENPIIIRSAEHANLVSSHDDNKLDTMSIPDLESLMKDKGFALNSSPEAKKLLKIYVKNYNFIKEVFFTNKFGHTVEASSQTSDFVQSDELWWTEGFNKKISIQKVTLDKSTNSLGFAISIAIPHPEDSSRSNGVIKVFFDFSEIHNFITERQFGLTGEAYLVNKDRLMITQSRFLSKL